jgi:hypothetical protein
VVEIKNQIDLDWSKLKLKTEAVLSKALAELKTLTSKCMELESSTSDKEAGLVKALAEL